MIPCSRRFVKKENEPKLILDLPLTSAQDNYDRISGQPIIGNGITYHDGYTRIQAQGNGSSTGARLTGLNLDLFTPGKPFPVFTREYWKRSITPSGGNQIINQFIHRNAMITGGQTPYSIYTYDGRSINIFFNILNVWFKIKEIFDGTFKKIYLNDVLIINVDIKESIIIFTESPDGVRLGSVVSPNTLFLIGANATNGATSVTEIHSLKYWEGIKE